MAPGWTGPPGKRLVRHITPQYMGEHHLGPFSPLPGTYPGFQGSKNGYYLAKSRPKWWEWLQAGPAHLESVWCAISHPKPWESITKGHFCHFQAPIQGSRGPKMAISWLNQDQMAGVAPGWTGPPGKCLVRHITPQYIGEHELGPFLSFPGTYPEDQVSKK